MASMYFKPMKFTPTIEILQQVIAKQKTKLKKANEQLQQEIGKRQRAEAALLQAQNQLETNVREQTIELERANAQLRKELQAQTSIQVKVYRRFAELEQRAIKQIEQLQASNQKLQREISNYKLLEEKLHTSEAKIRAFLEAMTDIIILVINTQGSNITVAPTNPGLLYEPDADIIGQTIQQFFLGAQAQTFINQIRKVLETQQRVNFEYSLPIGNAEFWFAAKISPFTSDSVIWIARDITQQKQAEAVEDI